MDKTLKIWRGPLAATLLLVLLVVVASFVATNRINQMEKETCFTRLTEEAGELARGIEQTMRNDREKLTLIAEIMADSPQDMEKFLNQYQNTGNFFSRLELLLPDDSVVTADGSRLDVSGQLSFAEQASLGSHLSDREEGLHGEGLVVRHYVPVVKDGTTIAMLFGVIELGTLRQELPYKPYGGQAAVYVIDGATGDFLIDTWHAGEEPGNIWEFGTRKMADGYDDTQLREELIEGKSNFVVFLSNTTKEYLYFYYAPLNINQWRIALSVPEDLAFAEARSIRRLLDLLLIAEGIAFIIYICWMIFYVQKETGEKQRQLDALNDIYQVEKLLFNAHEHPENVTQSLEIIGRMLPARRVAFTMLEREEGNPGYLWEEGDPSSLGAALLDSAPALAAQFARGKKEITAHSLSEVQAIVPGAPAEMGDLVSIPVEDADGVLRGILSASGLSKHTGYPAMLRSVGFSYSLLCSNTLTYHQMQRQGTEDALTGLYNRNRYEQDLSRIAGECNAGLCCVFIDVNGLHELNNSKGHEAGDHMLQAVARQLRAFLCCQRIYRVGGDEFIVFAVDGDPNDILRRSEKVTAALEQEGYHISVGMDWMPAPVEHLDLLVKTAEKRMYDAKQAYYRNQPEDRRVR